MAHGQPISLELAERNTDRISLTADSRSRPMRIFFLVALLAAGLGWTLIPDVPVVAPPNSVLGTQSSALDAARPPRSLREILALRDFIPTHDHPLLRRRPPDFELADAEGKERNLRELRNGRPMVLIFYYGSHCIHCARHLAEMNRDLPLFHEIGAQVIAVSPDPPELTRQRPQNAGLTILSDPGSKVAEIYGVFKRTNDEKIGNIRRHGTFIIDRDGIIRWANVGDAPFRRNSALLCALGRLEGRLPTARKQ
jgi:peroxiredoxin